MDLPCFLLSWLRNLQLIPLTQSQAEDDDDWEEGDDIFLYSPKNFLTISKPSHKSGTQKPSIGAKKEDEVLEVSALLCCYTQMARVSQKCCIFGDNFYKLSIQCSMYEK